MYYKKLSGYFVLASFCGVFEWSRITDLIMRQQRYIQDSGLITKNVLVEHYIGERLQQ